MILLELELELELLELELLELELLELELLELEFKSIDDEFKLELEGESNNFCFLLRW